MKTLTTCCYANLAGQRRKFELLIGGVAELERACDAGIGGIMLRIGTHQFKHVDVRETIRLALQGGGMNEPDATALVMNNLDGTPLAAHIGLAVQILEAFVNGLPETVKKKARRAGPTPAATASAGPFIHSVE